ncbi:hypothetical protein Anas_08738 [Armadillidium nasatum]|uniref:Uncharacterized protein n=1 Tax=Armadillidium nasatum TaxID=96803 RepID=A0A5N5SKK0_9CRUS|nr:hypothetical protein Anas_08738 [Armadillidium nasatum]
MILPSSFWCCHVYNRLGYKSDSIIKMFSHLQNLIFIQYIYCMMKASFTFQIFISADSKMIQCDLNYSVPNLFIKGDRLKYYEKSWHDEALSKYQNEKEENKVGCRDGDSIGFLFSDELLMESTTKKDFKIIEKGNLVSTKKPYPSTSFRLTKPVILLTHWSTMERTGLTGATSKSFRRNTNFSTPIEVALDQPEWTGYAVLKSLFLVQNSVM